MAETPDAEASWVAREVRRALKEEHRRPAEIAVLYRSNGQSRLVEAALREQGIAHRVVGGAQFFERKEVKDVLAYLKLALNPSDEISLRRVINTPPRGIGESTVDKLALHAAQRRWPLWQCIERVDALDDVPNAARDGCRVLADVVMQARRELTAAKRPASEVARSMCDRVELKGYLDANAPSGDGAAKKWANVEGVLATLGRREAREGEAVSGLDGLAGFLHLLTLNIENESEDASEVVTLSTLHGSKGLEFEVVFLIGCEEGYLPHARTIDARATDIIDGGGADIEEERRLFYVGVTRAKERLTLSRARSRVVRGKALPRTPSRFLVDVPGELLEEQEVTEEGPTTTEEASANVAAILAMLGK